MLPCQNLKSFGCKQGLTWPDPQPRKPPPRHVYFCPAGVQIKWRPTTPTEFCRSLQGTAEPANRGDKPDSPSAHAACVRTSRLPRTFFCSLFCVAPVFRAQFRAGIEECTAAAGDEEDRHATHCHSVNIRSSCLLFFPIEPANRRRRCHGSWEGSTCPFRIHQSTTVACAFFQVMPPRTVLLRLASAASTTRASSASAAPRRLYPSSDGSGSEEHAAATREDDELRPPPPPHRPEYTDERRLPRRREHRLPHRGEHR